uniref:Uncharacterized protein n=1 Tax=Knipowitschia caucasica TaxID=637954 RepID=A0AAV2LSU5_KNICA
MKVSVGGLAEPRRRLRGGFAAGDGRLIASCGEAGIRQAWGGAGRLSPDDRVGGRLLKWGGGRPTVGERGERRGLDAGARRRTGGGSGGAGRGLRLGAA